MRDQYAGDISDVLKFAFLRALTGADRKLGIAWYYVPAMDGRADGRHIEWRSESAWKRLDTPLHEGLSALPERSIAALERAPIWPQGTLFHREPVPKSLHRSAWSARLRAVLADADLVFLDPDNGLGGETERHATVSELRLLRAAGRTLAFITFPPRKPHETVARDLHARMLGPEIGAHGAFTLRTNVSVPARPESPYFVQRQRWFTVVDPDHLILARARAFATLLATLPRVRAQLDIAHR